MPAELPAGEDGAPIAIGAEAELCVQCLGPNQPGTAFCTECGAPLSPFAATGPYEAVFTEAHLYRRASDHPQPFIVALAMWVLFGMPGFTGLAILMLLPGRMDLELADLELASVLVLTTVYSALILVKTTRNYIRCRRDVRARREAEQPT